jgi:hypothetical protein
VEPVASVGPLVANRIEEGSRSYVNGAWPERPGAQRKRSLLVGAVLLLVAAAAAVNGEAAKAD